MRHINARFIDDLLCGELQYFLSEVKNNRNILSLEIRNGYINIYYKGGNLLKITQKANGYSFYFDAKYCKHEGGNANLSLLDNLHSADIDGYKKYFYLMMREMDAWFDEHPKEERDYQHQLLVSNPEIVDIEYQIGHRMRLDMLLFTDGKLMIVENKFGTGAIGGSAGISKHYSDICEVLNNAELLEEMIDSVCHISEAKKALGLTDTAIQKTDIKSVEILFLLANYNPRSLSLSNEVKKMNGSTFASVLITTSEQTKIELSKARDIFVLED
ncbi:MAG: hypothetical protein IKU84_04910 [Clostridia bacterium]|nr:hypothetical protein [Clostridia bacterium]